MSRQQGLSKTPMIPELFTPNLQRVLSFVLERGGTAVVDKDAVVIFNPRARQVEPGLRNINYRVERVHTLAEAWAVLEAQGIVRERRAMRLDAFDHTTTVF